MLPLKCANAEGRQRRNLVLFFLEQAAQSGVISDSFKQHEPQQDYKFFDAERELRQTAG